MKGVWLAMLGLMAGCLWKPIVAAEIGCRTGSTTFTKVPTGVNAQCNEPPGPLYDCVPSTNASGSVEWECTEAGAERQAKATRKATFNPEEYAPYDNKGSGAISGQAFLKTRGGEVKYAAGDDVFLIPVTSYSSEFWNVTIKTGQLLEGEPDPRSNKYMSTTTADGEGRFKFEGLAAGEYYVFSKITWEVPSGKKLEKTGGWAGAKVTVADAPIEVILKSVD